MENLTNWLSKYRATRDNIKESSEWGKYIIAEYDYGAGRINLPFDFQPEKIQQKMTEIKFLADLELQRLMSIVNANSN